jgi:hypothetical protein
MLGAGAPEGAVGMTGDPGDCWSTLFEADDLSSRVAIHRAVVKAADEKAPSATPSPRLTVS